VRTNIDVGRAENIYGRISSRMRRRGKVYANSRDRMKGRTNGDWPLLQLAHLRGLDMLVVDLEHEPRWCFYAL
jgi:hypothetical protein